MVPKLSAPLAKAIRTSEGIVVWLTNAGLVVAASIPAANLSVKDAAILAAVTNGLHIASRTLLKIVTVSKSAGLEPINFAPGGIASGVVAHAVGTTLYDVLADTTKAPDAATAEAQADTLLDDVQAITAPPAAAGETPQAPVDAAPSVA